MHEQEKLYEQYEDAVFALLMDKVAEENGKKLLQQNEALLADPDADVPETLSKRCLRTIEKAYRKSQWKAAAKKSDTGAQSGCFMDSGSALFVRHRFCRFRNRAGKNAELFDHQLRVWHGIPH